MDQTVELLQSVYENAELGRDVTERVIRYSPNKSFCEVLAEQFADYHRILNEAERLMLLSGYLPHPMRRVMRTSIFLSVSFSAYAKNTPGHLAEMLMQGALMGVIDMLEEIKNAPEASEEATTLARRLIATEDNVMQQLRGYVGC